MNRVDNAVRITHLPSGLTAECSADRSPYRNKATAMAELRRKVAEFNQRRYKLEQPELQAEVDLFMHSVGKLSQDLKDVRAAVLGYYHAMYQRQHGGVAMSCAMNKIEQVLGLDYDSYRAQKMTEERKSHEQ